MSSNGVGEIHIVELVRKQTYITAEQDRAVKRLAERHHTTEAEILRRALDDLLRREGMRDGEDPFAALIGFVWFGEVTDVWTWVGAAIIAGSSVYVAYREARLARLSRRGEGRAPRSPRR